MVKEYRQVPVTWDKGTKGIKHSNLSLSLPCNLLLMPPTAKPDQKLEGKRAHAAACWGPEQGSEGQCWVWKDKGEIPSTAGKG